MWNLFDQNLVRAMAMALAIAGFLEILFVERANPEHPNKNPRSKAKINREVKLDVYGKRQTAKIKLLPSVFSFLYSTIKIFVFAVNSKRHFSIFI